MLALAKLSLEANKQSSVAEVCHWRLKGGRLAHLTKLLKVVLECELVSEILGLGFRRCAPRLGARKEGMERRSLGIAMDHSRR
jgi:hypothetical protein